MISRQPAPIGEIGKLVRAGHADPERVTTHNAAESSAGTPDLAIVLWLFGLAAMVLGQVLLGGITRLSESGLSIMEWAPIMGVLPPLSESEWQRIFAIYRQTGEYRLINADIDLEGFKTIFWWEYAHRLWARCLALAFLVPFAWFWIKGRLTGAWPWRLGLIFALGALQGLAGWIMVASGFSDRTDVSQYRLAFHLLLALLIYALLLWSAYTMAWRTMVPADGWPASASLRRHGWFLVGLLAAEIGMGGLVAGLDAGLIYNTFPLMGAGLVPGEIGFVDPWWLDPLENPATVQFLHRWLALAVFILGLVLCWRAWRQAANIDPATIVLILLLFGQVALGIATLLLAVPLAIAVTHQACAFLLFGNALYLVHRWQEPSRD